MTMLIALSLTISFLSALPVQAENYIGHGVSLYGELKYGADFENFEYTNPDAPKGGSLTLASRGSFDSLNPFILKGLTPPRIAALLYDTLTEHADDEIFSEYGRLAESVEIPDDYSWVIFTLRKEARWHDGRAVTPEDVIFTLDALKTKGHPA